MSLPAQVSKRSTDGVTELDAAFHALFVALIHRTDAAEAILASLHPPSSAYGYQRQVA